MNVRVKSSRRCDDLHRALGEAHREIERLKAELAAAECRAKDLPILREEEIDAAIKAAYPAIISTSRATEAVDMTSEEWREPLAKVQP